MRVGILRPDRLGDTVVSLPIAGWIRNHLPEARIVWIARKSWEDLLTGHPWVDEVALSPVQDPPLREAVQLLRRLRLDAVLLAYSKPRWALAAFLAGIPVRVGPDRFYGRLLFSHRAAWAFKTHMVEQGKRLVEAWLGQRLSPLLPHIPVDEQARSRMKTVLPSPPRVVLHPEGGTARTWPFERFWRLAAVLQDAGVQVIWTGVKPEPEAGRGLDLRGRLSLRELVAVLSLADGVVVGATGVFHLAWALGRPVVALMDTRHRRHVDRWGSLHPRTVHLDLTDTGPSVEAVFQALRSLLPGRDQESERSGRRDGGGGISEG